MTVRILVGDVRDKLIELQDESVHCVVTSPPYFGLRDYGVAGQIGLEPSPAEYITEMVTVFREVRRVLRNDGTLWLNIGDSYANDGKWGGHTGGKHVNALHCSPIGRNKRYTGLKPKDLIGIPWMLAFALREDGWWLRQDIIWCLSGGTRVYARTKKGEMPMTIKDMVRLDPATVQLWNGEKWTQVLGWSQTPRPDKTYEIELRSGQRIGCTASHEWPVEPCGNIRADELRIGDVIRRVRLPEPENVKTPESLDNQIVGWFVGLYIAEGSRSEDTLQIAGHTKEEERFARLRTLASAFHGTAAVHKTSENGCTVSLNGPMLVALINTYVSGRIASDKHLHPRCWQRSDAFLRAVLDGYLAGDGQYDQQNDRWRLGFCANDELVADLRTLCARLGVSVRLKRHIHKIGCSEFPGYRGEIRFSRSAHHNSRDDGEIVAIRESRARQFWDIGVADEPHLFALASGVLTHNSKPNPMPESVTDRCTKAHEYLFLLSKSSSYHYDAAAIKEPMAAASAGRYDYAFGGAKNEALAEANKTGIGRRTGPIGMRGRPGGRKPDAFDTLVSGAGRSGVGEGLGMRNRRSVWEITTVGFAEAHFATFPAALVEPCILAGCPKSGTVLDPFFGAGTTGLVADRLGRDCIGIEINPQYAEMARSRIDRDAGMFSDTVCEAAE